MKIEQQQVGTVDVLTPLGPLVDPDAEPFCHLLLKRLGPNGSGFASEPGGAGAKRVVVCLEHVPYVDSTALNALATLSDQLVDAGANLKVCAVPPSCREILELTGLSARFEFFTDVPDAVRSFL